MTSQTTCRSSTRQGHDSWCNESRCLNGHCEGTFIPELGFYVRRCICDPGWRGMACDLCCDLPCVPGKGECHIDTGTMEPFCLCHDSTGVHCEKDLTDGPRFLQSDIVEPIADTSVDSECSAVPRNSGPTQCNGFLCYHGDCLSMTGSIFGAQCVCDPGWTGIFCDQCACNLACKKGKGFCQLDGENRPFCNCSLDPRYTGQLCDEMKYTTTLPATSSTRPSFKADAIKTYTQTNGQTDTTMMLPAVLFVSLFIVIILGFGLILYRMYRRRNPWMVKRITRHYAKKIDDSNRRFDVYISYINKISDRQFVTEQLIPFLKEERLTICVTSTSMMRTDVVMMDNLHEAVMKSKRIILVLSPEYIEWEWPHVEAFCINRRMLDTKRRFIPVFYKPYKSVKLDESRFTKHLRRLRNSVAYCEWLGEPDREEAFWQGLHARLPPHMSSKTSVRPHVMTSPDQTLSVLTSSSSQHMLVKMDEAKLKGVNLSNTTLNSLCMSEYEINEPGETIKKCHSNDSLQRLSRRSSVDSLHQQISTRRASVDCRSSLRAKSQQALVNQSLNLLEGGKVTNYNSTKSGEKSPGEFVAVKMGMFFMDE